MKRPLPSLLPLVLLAFAAPSAHATRPNDFAKKIVATPSASTLAKIGESTFTDFPVLVRLPAAASALLQTADGTDLLVTDDNETVCPFEVDTFDSSGETFVWVKVPSLSASTELTVYFGGDSNAGNDPGAVWSRYVAVVHGGASITNSVANGPAASAGSTAVTASANAGKVGGGVNKSSNNSIGLNIAKPSDALANSGKFSVSAWFKRNGKGGNNNNGTFILGASRTGWNSGDGYLWLQEQGKYISVAAKNAHQWSSGAVTLPEGDWGHVAFAYESGVSLTSYFNGVQDQTKSSPGNLVSTAATWTFGSYQNTASKDSFKGDMDELRIFNGVASGGWIALEYATMAEAEFFAYGDVESVDASAPVFETPTAVRNANGTTTVTVVLAENSGDVGVVYDAGTAAITNIVAQNAAPGTYTDTPANLVAGTTYAFAAYGKNANNTEVTKKGGIFYNGDLSVETISNADENGLVPGIFRISRDDTAYDLVVAYTVGGTATAGQTYESLSGTATILAGASYADIDVVPLLDPDTTSNTTVTVTLVAGLYGVDAQAGSAELTVVNLTAPAGFNTWISPSNSLASIASNWSAGHCPTASENVLFDGRFSTANCEWDALASATVASWTQTNGYTGIVTLKTVFPGKGDFTCLTVTGAMTVDGGTITHPQSRTQSQNAADYLQDLIDNETYRIRIDAGSLTVGASGRIDARNKGYYHSNTGNHVCPLPAHGGRFSATGQAPYDDPKEPIHIGMAYKRASGSYTIGIGGGAIYLTSAGNIVVNGFIGADTGSDTWNRGLTLRAAGSAGSVYVRGASITGTGTISASAVSTDEQNNRGVGGRVAVISTSSTPVGTSLQLKATVHPFNNSNKESTNYGGCGTVYTKDATQTHGTLLIQNVDGMFKQAPSNRRLTEPSIDGDWTFDAVGLGNYAILAIPTGTALHLPDGLGSVFSLNAASSTAYGSIRYEGGTLDLGSSASQTMSGNWMLTPWTNLTVNANLTVRGGAAIGVPPMADIVDSGSSLPTFVSCNLTVNGDLTVESDGFLLAKQCGLKKDKNSLNNGFSGVLQGHTHAGRCLAYKSKDAQRRFYTGYDSVFAPKLPGNSVPWPNGQSAEASGGVITLVVSGALTLDGEANVNGRLETYAAGANCSGGTGGSIDITAGSLSGSGRILAEAGTKQAVRGSAGRIAVKLTGSGADFSDFTGTISASGRALSPGSANDSSAGTVYLQTAANGDKGGTVYIAMSDGNRYANNTNTTEMVSLGYGGDSVDDYKLVSYVVSDYGHAAVNTNFTAKTVTIADENSSLDLEGHTLTVCNFRLPVTANGTTTLKKLPVGTYTASDTVVSGFVTDSGTGGTLVVTGDATVLIVK